MFVYKSAGKNNEYIVTLSIPRSTPNNLERSGVDDRNYAKFRCKSAKVISIRNKYTDEKAESVQSNWVSDFIYKVGETLTESNFDEDLERVCGRGIHFYLSEDAALFHGQTKDINGIWKSYNDNGSKWTETDERNELDTIYRCWYKNGNLERKMGYSNGAINGKYELFYKNGNKKEEGTCIDGCVDGNIKKWYENGILEEENYYIMGRLHKLHTRWYKNGKKEEEYTYDNGSLHGKCESWYENGNKKSKAYYLNNKVQKCVKWYKTGTVAEDIDNVKGKSKKWYEDGTLAEDIDNVKGICKNWYTNGQLSSEYTYTDKSRDEYHSWHYNGQKYQEFYYKGSKAGTRIVYNEDGTTDRYELYIDGQRISS